MHLKCKARKWARVTFDLSQRHETAVIDENCHLLPFLSTQKKTDTAEIRLSDVILSA